MGRPRFHAPQAAERLLVRLVQYDGEGNYDTWWLYDSCWCNVCSREVAGLRQEEHEPGCPIPEIIAWHKDWEGAS